MSFRLPKRFRNKAALAACAACALTTFAHAEYAVVDLGALVNASTGGSSSVGAINATGQVALTNSLDGLTTRGLRYSGGSTLNLGTLGGADSRASGINASGQVVGRSTTAAGVSHAFVWTPGGTGGVATNPQMKDLNPSGLASQATAINATGKITGYVTVPAQGQKTQDRAFLYSNGTL